MVTLEARNEATVRRAYRAINQRDWAALGDRLHDDVRLMALDPATFNVRLIRRREGVLAFLRDLLARLEEFEIEPEAIAAAGDRVVVWALQRGRAAGAAAETRFHFAHVWRLRDGRVASFRLYLSRERAERRLRPRVARARTDHPPRIGRRA